MDRLRELSLQPGVESIRLQVAQAEDMAEALHSLTIGSQSLRGLAEEEEKKIAAELVLLLQNYWMSLENFVTSSSCCSAN